MTNETERKRQAPISYRIPKGLRGEFARRVERSGLSVNAFITRALFDREPPRQSRRPSVNQQEVARLVAELARLRTQLEAIAQSAQSEPGCAEHTARIDDAIGQLCELRTACFTALGRGPRTEPLP